MPTPLYYVGTPEEVTHHARPLSGQFDLRIVTADEVVRVAMPGEVCVFFNEYFPRFREACLELKAKGCPTLYAIDGILEWRNSWELPESGTCCLWVMRPVLSHKVACIGRSQARVLESWGNLGKCEVVGVPRFDHLAGRRPRNRGADDPFRILVMTAKCPGFNPEQVERTTQSLADLKRWFDQHPQIGDTVVQPVWRLSCGLDEKLGVANQLCDMTGMELSMVLPTVDAVVTTPSTAMLEGMLQGLPVALLDYHNRPHYVAASWRIAAQDQFDHVLPELLAPSVPRMLYQESILHDALECHTPATPRLVELVSRMQALARNGLARGRSLVLPRRILRDPQDGHHLPEPAYDHERLFPRDSLAQGTGRGPLPPEAARILEPSSWAAFWDRQGPAYEPFVGLGEVPNLADEQRTRQWQHVVEEAAVKWQGDVAQAITSLQSKFDEAQREIRRLQQVERRSWGARLSRLREKMTKLLVGKTKRTGDSRAAA